MKVSDAVLFLGRRDPDDPVLVITHDDELFRFFPGMIEFAQCKGSPLAAEQLQALFRQMQARRQEGAL